MSGDVLFWGACDDNVFVRRPQVIEDLPFPAEVLSRGPFKDTGGALYPGRYCDSGCHGPLTRYVKLRVARAPGMPGSFPRHWLQRKPLVSDPGIHHGMCITHVPRCMLGSLTRGGGEKRYRHSRSIHNPQFYVSDKSPIRCAHGFVELCIVVFILLCYDNMLWVSNGVVISPSNTSGPLFTKRTYVLPQDLMKSRSREIRFCLFQSLWNLTGTSATALLRRLSNFKAILSLS